ncbi:MAG TPA: hypothetical protein VKU00_04535, partial [Chthonomonadaceae bacterium]|nr:hypothetical protein [Chthonomonadaceae bacterium]
MSQKQREEDFKRSQAWRANPGPSPGVEPLVGGGPSKEFIEGIIRMETAHGGLQRRVEEGDPNAIALRDDYLQIVKDSFTQPDDFAPRFNEWVGKLIAWYESLSEAVRQEIERNLPVPTKSLPLALLHKSDPINTAFILALFAAPNWTAQEAFPIGHALTFQNQQYFISIGLPSSDKTETLLSFFRRRGVLAVKAHYALWARWYEEGQEPGQYLNVTIDQFCSDLGYKKHVRGGFRLEHKQQAGELFEAMTSLQLEVSYSLTGKNFRKIQGPIWARGLIVWEGPSDRLRPFAFSYMPGPYYANEEWRQYHKAIGKISAGLLQLANDEDEWAILIGGYLGFIMRANQYRPRRLLIETVLRQTNLAQTTDLRRRASQYQQKFERALYRLKEVGVITSYKTDGLEATDCDDLYDRDAL